MTGKNIPGLVSCEWLSKQLSNKDSDLIILATDFAEPGSGYKWFSEGHIPKSRYFDLWKGVEVTPFIIRDLPNPEVFEKYVQTHGINEDTRVVLYDKDMVFFSARLWYQFKLFGHNKVYVLDGGLVRWQQLNLPMESVEQHQSQSGNFKVQTIDISRLANFEDFVENKYKDKQILDTRMTQDFEGKSTELSMLTKWGFESIGKEVPKEFHQGHIPGSLSMGFTDFLDSKTNCFKTPEQLLQAFTAIGIDPKRPVIGTCYSGISACMYPLALTQIDLQPGPFILYVGSWSEYGQKAKAAAIHVGSMTRE